MALAQQLGLQGKWGWQPRQSAAQPPTALRCAARPVPQPLALGQKPAPAHLGGGRTRLGSSRQLARFRQILARLLPLGGVALLEDRRLRLRLLLLPLGGGQRRPQLADLPRCGTQPRLQPADLAVCSTPCCLTGG